MEILNNEIFGLFLTIAVYYFSLEVSKKIRNPLFNPLFITTVLIPMIHKHELVLVLLLFLFF